MSLGADECGGSGGLPSFIWKGITSRTEDLPMMLSRGVSRGRGKKKWRAMIQHQKKQIHVGYYDSGTEVGDAQALGLWSTPCRPHHE